MDKDFLFNFFKEDIEKMIRNYIFEIDQDEYGLNKEYDFVEVTEFEEKTDIVRVVYQVHRKVGSTRSKVFAAPVCININKLYLFIANFKYLSKK